MVPFEIDVKLSTINSKGLNVLIARKESRRPCCRREPPRDVGYLHRKLAPDPLVAQWIERTLKLSEDMGKLSKNHSSMHQWRTDAYSRMVSRDLRIKLHEIRGISFDWPHLRRGQISLCSHKKCAFKTLCVQFCNEAKSCTYWLVNETLWYETEMRPRHLIFNPRRDRDRDLPTFPRDRDETETFGNYISRPSRRDRDYIPGR